MPAQVQSHPDNHPRGMHPNQKYPDQDPRHGASYKSEALRLALGSILSPKRPPLSNSRSSSGTASPAGYPFPHVPASGVPQTPSESHYTDYLIGKVGHSPHTPSKLARGTSADDVRPSSEPTSPHLAPKTKPEEPISPLPASAMGQGSPASASPPANQKGSKPASGTGTPRATFIQTLEGKNHWDALIHGSFS